jgi:hypothetical protein
MYRTHYFQKSEDIKARIFADGSAEFPVSAFNRPPAYPSTNSQFFPSLLQ